MRAPIQWYGGKGILAPWVSQYIPRTEFYAEPYCGAASMLFYLEPRPCEAINDLDDRIVTLFRVLQGPRFDELNHRLKYTLYSVSEFAKALDIINRGRENADDVDFAWAVFVSLNQGFSGIAETRGNWSRTFVSSRGMAMTVSTWTARLDMLEEFRRRLLRVQIDSRCALEFIKYWDCEEGCFYVDPPYVTDTRVNGNVYAAECTDDHHRELVTLLKTCKAAVVLSGYESDLYSELGWTRHTRDVGCSAAGRVRGSKLRGEGSLMEHALRTECLWVNPKAERLVRNGQLLMAFT